MGLTLVTSQLTVRLTLRLHLGINSMVRMRITALVAVGFVASLSACATDPSRSVFLGSLFNYSVDNPSSSSSNQVPPQNLAGPDPRGRGLLQWSQPAQSVTGRQGYSCTYGLPFPSTPVNIWLDHPCPPEMQFQ